MPLSKKRMRERKRLDRSVKPMSNLITNTSIKSIPGLVIRGNRIVSVTTRPGCLDTIGAIPKWVNYADVKPVDADGNPVPDYC